MKEEKEEVNGQLSVVNERKREVGCQWSVGGGDLSTKDTKVKNIKNCLSTKDIKLNSKNSVSSVFSVVNPFRVLRVFRGKDFRAISEIRGYIFKLWPYFLIILIFIPISIVTQSNAGAVQSNNFFFSFNRLYLILYNIYWYSAQTLICFENSPMYHPYVITYYSILEICLLYTGITAILITLFIKSRKFFLFVVLPLIMAYLISLLPVIGLIKLGPTDHADRYSYIPSVFIWFLVGLLLNQYLINKNNSVSKVCSSFLFKRKFVLVLLTCYTVTLIVLNIQYQKFWKNTYTLFNYANSYYHVNAHILISLADMEMAKKNYNRVLELTKDLNNDKRWKLIADFYKVSILFNENRKQSLKPLLQLKALFKKNLSRKIFAAKNITINEMLASFPRDRNFSKQRAQSDLTARNAK